MSSPKFVCAFSHSNMPNRVTTIAPPTLGQSRRTQLQHTLIPHASAHNTARLLRAEPGTKASDRRRDLVRSSSVSQAQVDPTIEPSPCTTENVFRQLVEP
jgi:hypothetical protein